MDSTAPAPSSADSALERDLLPVLQAAKARSRRWRGVAKSPSATRTADLIPILAALKASQQRWRRTAMGFGCAFVVLLVLAGMRFAGTLMACKLVGEARRARPGNQIGERGARLEQQQRSHGPL